MAAAEHAARERDYENRTPSANGTKRLREWEDEHAMKQPPEEKRQRLDEPLTARPPSVPMHGYGSPPRPQSSFDHEAQARRQAEEQRRANENYHPSEAAHHPPSLPSINQQPIPSPQLQQLPRMSEAVKQEPRREVVQTVLEGASRKIDVDEDYDDDEDEKRPAPTPSVEIRRDSPKNAVGGPGLEPAAVTAGA
jgi:glucose repression mediator protein